MSVSSPESSSSSVGFMEMSDLMLPASAFEREIFGVPQEDSGATVVSSASSYDEIPREVNTTILSPSSIKQRKSSAASERRRALPSTLMLSDDAEGALTHAVPEFLCHLHTMLSDPSYSDFISWMVPRENEPDHMGGGVAGIGKIVVHKPESLQESVLGNYYRHSKYASFQRQLNYFGFKKRLHNGKKGKLSPCSYIHESLTEDMGSLYTLKRRPPSKKRGSEEADDECTAMVSSNEDVETSSPRKSKKRRVTTEKKPKKSGGGKCKSRKEKKQKKQSKTQIETSVPHRVEAEEYGPPSVQSSATIENNQYEPDTSASSNTAAASNMATTTCAAATTDMETPAPQDSEQPAAQKQPATSPPASHSTLLELLSTSLPPPDILFNDAISEDLRDDEGMPAWVTDDGKYHYHNVDSSLVDLAMLY
eukprot:CAMPEP_0172553110 /NCGR_PEP_ID=MMETSP1067-20121228/48539_1 /TAXON_ID=265564 ORGANISM="Thalassiosira punctigera, Strain Tpunct2005C2" /NCGR_SAMPLE_ID=MMETSP1067 /ASSEMBLY_ACC=CAM_ASM_000444 /LENGTH=421 /DNA_ID=CAMNT_0013341221 /DNA_START=350 /DNA_END=1615 /DNA_ORIENTATION=-